jgi:hypothetical protein
MDLASYDDVEAYEVDAIQDLGVYVETPVEEVMADSQRSLDFPDPG